MENIYTYNWDMDLSDDFIDYYKEQLEERLSTIKEDLTNVKPDYRLYDNLIEEKETIEDQLLMSNKDFIEHFNDEYYEYINEMDSIYWEDFESNVNSEWISGYYIISGSAGLWNGTKSIDIIKYFDSFTDFLKELSDTNYIEAEYNSDKNTLDWKHSHHDGTNSYYLTLLDELKKSEFKDIIESKYYSYIDTDVNEFLKYYYGCTYSNATKEALVSFIEEHADEF